jgi:hypothetical protein
MGQHRTPVTRRTFVLGATVLTGVSTIGGGAFSGPTAAASSVGTPECEQSPMCADRHIVAACYVDGALAVLFVDENGQCSLRTAPALSGRQALTSVSRLDSDVVPVCLYATTSGDIVIGGARRITIAEITFTDDPSHLSPAAISLLPPGTSFRGEQTVEVTGLGEWQGRVSNDKLVENTTIEWSGRSSIVLANLSDEGRVRLVSSGSEGDPVMLEHVWGGKLLPIDASLATGDRLHITSRNGVSLLLLESFTTKQLRAIRIEGSVPEVVLPPPCDHVLSAGAYADGSVLVTGVVGGRYSWWRASTDRFTMWQSETPEFDVPVDGVAVRDAPTPTWVIPASEAYDFVEFAS